VTTGQLPTPKFSKTI